MIALERGLVQHDCSGESSCTPWLLRRKVLYIIITLVRGSCFHFCCKWGLVMVFAGVRGPVGCVYCCYVMFCKIVLLFYSCMRHKNSGEIRDVKPARTRSPTTSCTKFQILIVSELLFLCLEPIETKLHFKTNKRKCSKFVLSRGGLGGRQRHAALH